jgi:hypothetical protein
MIRFRDSLTMDLVAMRDGTCCGVDLVGYPGEFEGSFPTERYKMFYRAGFKILPVPYSRWILDRDRCLDAIETTAKGQSDRGESASHS